MPTVKTRTTADNVTRYYVRLRDPRRGNRQTSEVFDTEPEAAKFCRLVEAIGAAKALDHLDADAEAQAEPTLDQWAERHFASLTNVTEGTRTTYKRIYERTWKPLLGRHRLSQLDRETVATAVQKVPGSDKTVRNAWGILANMCKVAVLDGLIPKSPCVGIKLAARTSHEKTEHRYLTSDEFWHLVGTIDAHWRPLLITLGGTGMRWGEAEALTVADVDLEAGFVRINKAVKWDPSKASRLVGPTKTPKSKRTVPLPTEVVDALRPLTEGRKGGERLFLSPRGEELRHRTFWSRYWRPACVAAELEPAPRIHDLRHSHVAWLIGAGTQLPVIQARLGHQKIATTIDTYGHLLPDIQRAAADAASAVWGRASRAIE